jgi:hypothetical protein
MVRVLNKRHLDLTTPISPQLHRALAEDERDPANVPTRAELPAGLARMGRKPNEQQRRFARARRQGKAPGQSARDGYGSHHARGPWYSTRTMNRYCFHLLQGGNVGPSAAA